MVSSHRRLRRVYYVLVYSVVVLRVTSYVNVALNKPAIQSNRNTNHEPGTLRDGDARKAVDGNNNPAYRAGSCSHTGHDSDPGLISWWMVDLLREEKIEAVNITNRLSVHERLQNFTISASKENPFGDGSDLSSLPGEQCTFVSTEIDRGKTELLTCEKPIKGRFVYVYKVGFGALTLCEFEVLVTEDESKSVKKEGSYIKIKVAVSKDPFYSISSVPDVMSCCAFCQSAPGHNISTWIEYQRSNGQCDCIQFSPLVDYIYFITLTNDKDALCLTSNFGTAQVNVTAHEVY